MTARGLVDADARVASAPLRCPSCGWNAWHVFVGDPCADAPGHVFVRLACANKWCGLGRGDPAVLTRRWLAKDAA